MSENLPLLIPLFGIVFGVGVPLSIPIIIVVLNYRKRRQLMELHHAERMAAIERGMEIPALPVELIESSGPRRRTSLLPGLVWFFIGLALLLGTMSMDDDIPIIGGLIPLGVGVAYLIYYFAEGRKMEARLLQQDLARQAPAAGDPQRRA